MIGRISWRTLTIVAFVGPLVTLGLQAVSVRWFYPDVLPHTFTVDAIHRVGFGTRTVAAFRTGVAVSGAVTVVACGLAWPAARVLARSSFRGRGAVLAVLFLPNVIPAVGLALGLDVALLRLDLAGDRLGVVIAHLVPTMPYTVLVLMAVFSRIDERAEAQATVLGANPWQTFRLVTLRLVGPGLVVAALFTFLVSWSQYLLTLLVGGGHVVTITMLVFTAVAGGNPTNIAVLALAAALPPLAILAIAGRMVVGEMQATQ